MFVVVVFCVKFKFCGWRVRAGEIVVDRVLSEIEVLLYLGV